MEWNKFAVAFPDARNLRSSKFVCRHFLVCSSCVIKCMLTSCRSVSLGIARMTCFSLIRASHVFPFVGFIPTLTQVLCKKKCTQRVFGLPVMTQQTQMTSRTIYKWEEKRRRKNIECAARFASLASAHIAFLFIKKIHLMKRNRRSISSEI